MALPTMASRSLGQPSQAPIDKLPNEVLSYIFEYCQPFEGEHKTVNSWVRFMRVCLRWYNVAERVLYNQMTLYVGGYPGPYAINIIEEPEIRSFVQSVELRDFYNGDNGRKITRQVLRLLNAVRTLTIGIGFRLFDTGVFRLVRQMPLTEVKLLSVPRVETVFEFYDIPTLTRLNVEKRLNPDDRSFPPARDLEHVLPPSRERTSTITYLRIWWPDAPLYITEKLLLWPANLETVRLHWLPKDSQNSEYNFQTLWEKLLLHAATLKVLEIGALPLRKNDIPNFSGFSNLEKITMYTGDLMCLDPKTAVRMLAAPQLEHLVLNCLKDFAWADHCLFRMQKQHYHWLRGFLIVIKNSGSLPGLRLMQIDSVSLSARAYDLELLVKQCQIHLVFVERTGFFGEDYSVISLE